MKCCVCGKDAGLSYHLNDGWYCRECLRGDPALEKAAEMMDAATPPGLARLAAEKRADEGLDGKLAVMRNGLAMGRFDGKEKEILGRLLSIFHGFVQIHREESERLKKDIENAIENCGADFDEVAKEMAEDEMEGK